jgi:hypothetical protein
MIDQRGSAWKSQLANRNSPWAHHVRYDPSYHSCCMKFTASQLISDSENKAKKHSDAAELSFTVVRASSCCCHCDRCTQWQDVEWVVELSFMISTVRQLSECVRAAARMYSAVVSELGNITVQLFDSRYGRQIDDPSMSIYMYTLLIPRVHIHAMAVVLSVCLAGCMQNCLYTHGAKQTIRATLRQVYSCAMLR